MTRNASARFTVVLAALVVLGLAAFDTATAVRAAAGDRALGGRTAQAEAATGSVALVSQPAWTAPGDPFDLRLRLSASGESSQLEVAVTVYPRVSNRTNFVQSLEGRLRTSGLEITRVALADLVADDDGVVTFRITPELARDGVYPVRVELREKGGGAVLDTFTTHLVRVPAVIEGERLRIATLMPLHAPPAVRPDGTTELDVAAADHLAMVAQALEAHSDVAVVLRPTPETLDALATSARERDRATLFALARVRSDHQLLAAPYVPADLPALLDAGLDEEVRAQFRRGRETLIRALGVPPTEDAWVSDERVDERVLPSLGGEGVERVVVAERDLVPVDLTTTLTQPFELELRSRGFQAAAADPQLTADATRPGNPVLAAHHLLADLAVVYFDRPGRPGVVVLAPPRDWRPAPEFLSAFLGGLRAHPVVGAVSLDGVFEVPVLTSGRRPLVRQLTPQPPPSRYPAGAARAARRRLDSFSTILEPGNAVFDRIERTLLTSQSTDIRPRARSAYLDGVRAQVNQEVDRIRMPDDRSITLTARQGEIPVTISNRTGYPVRAMLRVQSETLLFPHGDRRPLDLTRPNTTERFTVRARSSGAFPLRVRLESPDGALVLAQTRFTVRSTAASGVGLAISAGAASFLLIWWARHLRGRRSRRLVPA